MKGIDLTKSIEQLEGDVWGPPEYDSYLVTTVQRLRKKPLSAFTVEDLRICIGQQIAVRYLVPLALERLSNDPFVEGDFYRGDLLKNVVQVNSDFWYNHPHLTQQLSEILKQAESQIEQLNPLEKEWMKETITVGFARIAAG